MEKPKLFEERREFFWTLVLLLFLLLLRLGWEYHNYREFISKPFYFTEASVLNAYEKHKAHSRYQVLKLVSDEGQTFYTTIHRKENLLGKQLRVQLFPDGRIGFWDYLGTFYVKSRIKQITNQPDTLSHTLHDAITKQHTAEPMQQFYNAIFFATPLSKTLREKIALLGVSHLVALSGFHLGILWGLIYGALWLLYKPLQQRYFPYRFALIDIGLAVLVIIGVYVWFVGAPPSLLRAFVMLSVGWLLLVVGVQILNFEFLFFVLALLVVLAPSLLVSLGFWFSVAGVFYIYLLLHHFEAWSKWHITLWIIPLGIFVLMLPVVHTFFPVTSPYQLLSPLLSLLFIPFYPLAMLLHLIGYGDLFDNALQGLFALPKEGTEHLLPRWLMVTYIGLSFAAIRSRKLFYLLLLLAAGYALYLFV
ncbi:MAG: ComEC/Rec2 family competence protein [Sulfurovum sp.]|nr:ComEC/Rec2 family competence protein [Sulfurovum sp.]